MSRGVSFLLILFYVMIASSSCSENDLQQDRFDIDQSVEYCKSKLSKTVKNFNESERLPRSINDGEEHWNGNSINSWTSGFYPGILWNMYEMTGEEIWLRNATYYTGLLEPVKNLPWKTHDFGFMMYYSYGLGYQMTNDQRYKEILLETADSLATLYNPNVGTMESWPWMKRKRGWKHTTIIDNMMNLELLFWAAKNGGDPEYENIAEKHALKTLSDFVRDDHSTFHVVVYDSISPSIVLKTTDQGYDDNSTWARGHSWGTYGFVKAYTYTKNAKFLEAAEKLAAYYLNHVQDDLIPYWDFNAPGIPNEPKDASAAAIMSCALLELSKHSANGFDRNLYFNSAYEIIKELSSNHYLAKGRDAFLQNSVGSRPAESEVTSSLIYTDYFYLEALKKLKTLKQKSAFARMD